MEFEEMLMNPAIPKLGHRTAREEWKAMLPVIQGYAEGKTVECRQKDIENAPWDKVDIVINGFFDLQRYEYRLRPEGCVTQEYIINKELKGELILQLIEIEIACMNSTSSQIQIIKDKVINCANFIRNHCRTEEL